MTGSRPLRIVRENKLTFSRWALSLAGFAVAIWGLLHPGAGWPLWRTIWVIGATALGVVFLVLGVREWWRRLHGPTPTAVTPQALPYVGPYTDWQSLGDGPTHAIYSPALNKRLASDDVIRVQVDGDWSPTGRAAEERTRQLQMLKVNESKYRLASDLLEHSTEVTLQRTDYAAFVATNRLAYEAWWSKKLEDYEVRFDMVEAAAKNGYLPRLVDSACSNHLGGDVLAIGENFTFLQKQAATAHMYPGLWVGSASGSFDLDDLTPSARGLQDLVRTGLLRELREEMSVPAEQLPGPDDITVIGYSRATYLGGKPQFYGVSRIGRVKPVGDRYTDRFHRLDFEGAGGLIAALQAFEREHQLQLSPPLQMLIRVVTEWLRNDPAAEGWLWPTDR